MVPSAPRPTRSSAALRSALAAVVALLLGLAPAAPWLAAAGAGTSGFAPDTVARAGSAGEVARPAPLLPDLTRPNPGGVEAAPRGAGPAAAPPAPAGPEPRIAKPASARAAPFRTHAVPAHLILLTHVLLLEGA